LDDDLDEASDEHIDNLPETFDDPLSHPMIPKAFKSIWKLFPVVRIKRIDCTQLPPEIFRPAFNFLLDAHTHNRPIHILPDNPLGPLARYLATTYPTRAGPAP
jgi:hypothetical protein